MVALAGEGALDSWSSMGKGLQECRHGAGILSEWQEVRDSNPKRMEFGSEDICCCLGVTKNLGAVAWTMLPPRSPSSPGLGASCPAPAVAIGTFFL